MGKVVHRIDAPLITRAVMLCMHDTVHHRIAHIQVLRSHVYFGAQSARTIGKLSGPHALKQVEVFCYRPVAPGTLPAWLGKGAAILAQT